METLLKKILEETSVHFLKKEELELYLLAEKSLMGPHCNIDGCINGYAIAGHNYNLHLNKLSSLINGLHNYSTLKLFLDIFILNNYLEKKDSKSILDSSDIFMFSNFGFPPDNIPNICGKINNFLIKDSENMILKSEMAQRFKLFGLNRRLCLLRDNLIRLINVYDIKRYRPLTKQEQIVIDTHLNLFYPNICAILDCLAFILQFELKIRNPFNYMEEKECRKISLFSEEFGNRMKNTQISSFKAWSHEIKKLRHSIAHRIPYYNVSMLTNEELKKQNDITEEIHKITIEFNRKEFPSLNRKYKEALSKDSNTFFKALNKMNKAFDKLDEKKAKKLKGIENIGVFSGIFTDDIYEKNLHHTSRMFLDFYKLFLVIGIVFNFIKESSNED